MKDLYIKDLWPWPNVLCMIAHFIILQKGFLVVHSLRFILRLVCFAEADHVQSTFIDMATFKRCKNVNGRFINETILRKAVKMCWNIVIAFVRLILIAIFLKQLLGDISLTLKNRNLQSEYMQKIYGHKTDKCYVYDVWLNGLSCFSTVNYK